MATRLPYCCLVFLLTTSVTLAGPAAKLSATELREQIAACQEQIASLEIETRSDDYSDQQSKDIGKYVICIIAAKSPSSLLHVKSHGTRQIDWRLDPDMQRAIIADGRGMKINDLNRTYVELPVKDDDALPGTLSHDFLWAATGIFPLSGRPAPQRPDGGPISLRQIATDPTFNMVREELELVDGRWCHVLERPGRDVLWIDVEHGCAMMAREFCSADSGDVFWRCEATGFAEQQPGIWLPNEFHNIHFGPGLSPDGSRQVTLSTIVRVTRMSVNSVPEKTFEFVPLPGALLLNSEEGNWKQTIPGGTDHLDRLVDFSRSAMKDRWSIGRGASSDKSALRPLLIGAIIGVVMAWFFPGFSRTQRLRAEDKES